MEFLALDRRKAAFCSDANWTVRMQNGVFWGYKPNSEFVVSADEFVNTAHIDDLGGRKVLHEEGMDKSRPVLPFLGDSFTFGVGVSDEETFASMLSAEVQDARILNLGLPGTPLNRQRRRPQAARLITASAQEAQDGSAVTARTKDGACLEAHIADAPEIAPQISAGLGLRSARIFSISADDASTIA
jgi:hypothetical protein